MSEPRGHCYDFECCPVWTGAADNIDPEDDCPCDCERCKNAALPEDDDL